MKKGDVEMAKRFSKKKREQGMSFQLPAILNQSYVKMPVSAWYYIPTSLLPEPSSTFYYLKLNSGIGH